MFESSSAWRAAPSCCVHSRQPLQQTAAPCRPRIRARTQHAAFSGGPMAHPSASTCRQQRQRQQFGRLSAHRSSSQSVQVAQADLESRSDGDQTQLRLGSWTGAVTRPLQWRLPRGARTAVLLSALVAAVYAAADPALADTIHSQTAAGPFVPGLIGDSPIREGVVEGFLLIFLSELGDKTFFIAALLALKYKESRGVVFGASFGALAVMTVISVCKRVLQVGLGLVLHQADELIDTRGVPLDDLVAVALLLYFGIRTLQEASNADEKAKEEEEDAQEATETIGNGAGIFFQIFALVFAAEWGDKSFLATIALSASSSPLGVVTGAIGGHAVATTLAILGGSVLSKYVSERTVQYVGGSLFLVFAASTIVDIVRGV